MSAVSDYFGTLTGNLKKGGNITVMPGLLRRNPCFTGKSLRSITSGRDDHRFLDAKQGMERL